jgi:methylmalonyl-CoA mutase C-terminal domain/subunit
MQIADCGIKILKLLGLGLSFRIPKSEIRNSIAEESMERKIRILIAKPGLDGHDRGAKIIARGFRDAGFEVIYTGLHQTPEQIVAAAIQEDVDGIGLSILSGAHDYIFPQVIELLKEKGANDIAVFGGGIIPEEDILALKGTGVKALFVPGTTIEEAVKWVRENIKPRK